MFEVMFGIAVVLIVVVGFAIAIGGTVLQFGLVRKIFKLAERELDRKAAANRPPETVACTHCGKTVVKGEDCPNCGAAT